MKNRDNTLEHDQFLYMPTANGNIKQEKQSKPLHTASGYIQFVYRNPVITGK